MIIKEAFSEFEKPSVAIDVVLTRVVDSTENTRNRVASKGLQVLLVKKEEETEWYLPGTILRLGETPSDAIERIINSKVDIKDIKLEQLYTVADNPARDERGHIISIVYIGKISNETSLSNELARVGYKSQWFWVEKSKETESNRHFVYEDYTEVLQGLKYDHSKIIDDTVKRLQKKLMHTDVAFDFVGKEFTLNELENTFVAINEKSIPGFRRVIAPKVEGTGKRVSGKVYRPAELFKKKELNRND